MVLSCFCISRNQEGFFGNRLRELVSLVEQIICDRFAKNELVDENWVAFFIMLFLNIPNNPNHFTNWDFCDVTLLYSRTSGYSTFIRTKNHRNEISIQETD